MAAVDLFRNNVALPGAARAISPLTPGIHKFRAEASGGTLKAYLNGVLITSATDPAPLPTGNPGFWFGTQTGDLRVVSLLRITSFEVSPVRCPPTGFPVLDDPVVQHGLNEKFEVSFSEKRERGGWILKDIQNGLRSVVELQGDYPRNACNISFPEEIPVFPGQVIEGSWHTHVLKPGTLLEGLCPNRKPRERSGDGPSAEYDMPLVRRMNLDAYIIDENEVFPTLAPTGDYVRVSWTLQNGCRRV